MTFTTLPGFRDFLPEDCAVRNHLFRLWRETALRYGFVEFDGPVLEPLELFTAKSGDEIASQLFEFEDRGGRRVAMRPEMTPTLARMVGARANAMRKPVKWFSIGENFRYERPQKGRLRSFYQFNADLLGEESVAGDAEIIALLVQLLRTFGLTEEHFQVRLSDRRLWMALCASVGLDEEQTAAALGTIDKMERTEEAVTRKTLTDIAGSPERADHLYTQAKQLAGIDCIGELQRFFQELGGEDYSACLNESEQLLDALNAMGLGGFVRLDPGIVRGLAYYTGIVFEAFQTIGDGRALAGGGRYDHLVEKLGGPSLSAVGFGMGDVTLRNLLEEVKLLPNLVHAADVFVVVGSDAARPSCLRLVQNLRECGYRVEYPLKATGFGKQFKLADQHGARFALIIGDEEMANNVVKVRDMRSRSEQAFPALEVIPALGQAFAAGGLEPEAQG